MLDMDRLEIFEASRPDRVRLEDVGLGLGLSPLTRDGQ